MGYAVLAGHPVSGEKNFKCSSLLMKRLAVEVIKRQRPTKYSSGCVICSVMSEIENQSMVCLVNEFVKLLTQMHSLEMLIGFKMLH